jgi:protein SCO1
VKRGLALLFIGALLTGCAHPGIPAPDFTLTSDNGAPWTLSAQRGKVVALFFGFTHCDDTCPDTLAKLAASLHKDGATPATAEVAFVTIDPQRDTPAVMHRYKQRFSGAQIVGLTGTPAQIASVENDYHVWSQKIAGKKGSDDYDEAHSAFTFLIDRNGNQRMIHNDDDPQRDFVADLATLLR